MVYLYTSNIYALINYVGFATWVSLRIAKYNIGNVISLMV